MLSRFSRNHVLIGVKLLHSAVWLFFAGCILAIPIAGLQRDFHLVRVLTALVLMECAVLALNRGTCPITDIAARYTEERAANFDIYLPHWLTLHNKEIFGTLFVASELFVLYLWLWGGTV